MFYKNVDLKRQKRITPWRKISLGSWRPTGDSSIYTMHEFLMDPVIRFCKKKKISIHAFLIKAVGYAVAENSHINAIIRFGRVYPRSNVDIFYHILAEADDGENLSGAVFRSPDKKTVKVIQNEYEEKSREVLEEGDKVFKRTKRIFSFLPGFVSRLVLDTVALVTYKLNLWSPLLGTPRDPFGSIMITNIGSLGIDMAYCPIAPYTNNSMVISAGSVRTRPWVEGNQVKAKKTMKLCFTYDHRIMDGIHFMWLKESLEKVFQSPEKYLT